MVARLVYGQAAQNVAEQQAASGMAPAHVFVTVQDFEGTDDGWSQSEREPLNEDGTIIEEKPSNATVIEAVPAGNYALTGQQSLRVTTLADKGSLQRHYQVPAYSPSRCSDNIRQSPCAS